MFVLHLPPYYSKRDSWLSRKTCDIMPHVKTVVIDIETSPIVAHVWGLRDPRVAASQIVAPSRVLCVGIKELEKRGQVLCSWDNPKMIEETHAVLDSADVLVHFNGRSFDVPHLNREFAQIGLGPPSPYKQVDLWRTVRQKFRFETSSLKWVASRLLESQKLVVDHKLWVGVLAGDPKAQAAMKRYNKQDLNVTEEMYNLLLPWIDGHPNVGLWAADDLSRCPACGEPSPNKRGFYYTSAGRYQQYQCSSCGKWSRDSKREVGGTPLREAR